jgi:uroporphyrinogen-III synthase
LTPSMADRVVLITRPAEHAEALADRLRGLGAEPVVAPTIRLVPPEPGGDLDAAIRDAAGGRYAWVVFTSEAGVTAWSGRAAAVRAGPVSARLAAVGRTTAEAVRSGIGEPDLVPPVFTTAALADAFPPGSGAVLLPRADLATEEMEDALRGKGWTPVRVDAYRVVPAESIPAEARRALEEERVDAITFTYPSTVDGFVGLAGVPSGPAVVCIGPVTARAASEAGFRVAAVADPHTTDGLVDAVARALDGSM